MVKVLVIGGVAAGTTAASQAKRSKPDVDVTLVQEESHVSYGSCGMPYVFEKLVPSFDDLIVRSANEFKEKYGIKVFTNTKAIKISPPEKKVTCINTQTNEELVFEYDKLIIATGARSIQPPIKGIDQKNVFSLRTLTDGKNLYKSIPNAKSCVIIGAGLVGLEMAEAFKNQGLDVTVIEMDTRILSRMVNENLSEIVSNHIVQKGVVLKLDEQVMEISTDKEDQKIVTTKNFTIKTDFVLVGVGVRPNSELAQEAGIDQGIAKAIKVDSKMRTNLADIYAVGDCATARNYVTDKDSYLPLGTTANKQGRIAGRNCVENDLYSFEGIAASAITKVFDLLVGSTGLSLKDAQNEDFEAVENMIEGHTRAKYYPDGKKIWINLVADKSTHRILGAQIVGEEFVKGRIDQIALALFLKAKVEDLIHYDWCYVPPVSPVIDPLNIAASQLEKKLN
ncbi:MAG: FAD-dependent oxidoreductase [Nitrosopumilaceae archaeon]|jgi:NADPH-dependent 2,4-dienoyl-CoA reductase/sulfur reductase-like enzyme